MSAKKSNEQLGPLMPPPISQIAGLGLLVTVVAIWYSAAPAMWTLIGNGTVIALAVFVLVGLAVGHFLGGPAPENRTSLAFSTASSPRHRNSNRRS